ncbi:zinc ABC transporter substrate-binding protein [Tritonibacter mobilis]|uniref:zinc ABC transporter substrate-binding protein n=1 Tax=Tritonibacter mobilis TaxID=379347 RepID=UPI001C07FA5E|nr:zinc ABC transporter substrate-binding protein [Tritonibacter mobilis]MBU3033725.1 zinc ABC transporter substrate-binding protein [Tritonibacter mobilis]WHQ84780.1 zinc ABC transporter substrate-binding protein [Tritonibacter mobilis]
MPKSVLSALFLSVSALPVFAETPRVVADIAPVQGLVARVMAGVGEPDLLVPPGASPHGHSLKPSDARALSSADAVFWVGDALSPWLEGSLEELASDAHVVSLLETPGTLQLEFRNGAVFAADGHDDHGHDDNSHDGHDHADHDEHAHDHGDHDAHGHDHSDHDHDDHGHDHADHDHSHGGHDHGDHGHSHEGVDPHAWLAPQNGKQWLTLIAEELAEIDPTNAEIYQSNALAGQAEIDAVVEQVRAGLSQTQGEFVVFHDAYQYFEHSFGVSTLGAISLADASDPSVARIAEIREAIAETNVSCVFSEPQFNPGLVATVAEGRDVKSVVIDPLGTEIAPGASFYTDLLTDIGADFVECLSR